MILTAPTGSYLVVLPKGPLDPTSVIYTISAGPPPRDGSVSQKLPDGVRDMRRSPRKFTNAVRRISVGDLVYTTKAANPIKVIGSSRQYGYGQILDFVEVPPVALIDQTVINSSITTKHNNNYLDLSNMGLDDNEQNELAAEAVLAQQGILDQIGELQKTQSSLEVDIKDFQGQINESTKVLAGLNTIIANGGKVTTIRDKIQIRLDSLNSQLAAASAAYNLIPDQILALRSSLTALTDLVK